MKKVNPKTYGKATTRTMKLLREEDDGTITTAYILQIEGVAKLHNWDGPARINKAQKIKEYYLSGIQYSLDDWGEMRKHRNGLPPSKRSAPPGYTNRS